MTNHLFDALHTAQGSSDRVFMCQSADQVHSFKDFFDKASQLAHKLVALGLTPDDRVVVQVEKSVEVIALYVATIQAGGVFLPLNPAYTVDEVSYFIRDAKPRIVVCAPSSQDRLMKLVDPNETAFLTLDDQGVGSLTDNLDEFSKAFCPVPRQPDDLAALLYTSGTTGRSKGAMMSHANLLSNAETLVQIWKMDSQDRLIHALPVFHTHGLFVALNTALLAGCTVDFQSGFSCDQIMGALPHATMIMGVPTFYTRLLQDSRLTKDTTASMRLFISGSAPLLAETHHEFTRRTGHRILERYGMTETNMITSNPIDGDRRAGTVGLPLPGVDLRVTDPESGAEVSNGSIGIVELHGPNVFKGYWQMPEKTAAEFREDGFFQTGDLGWISEDGYLTIVGRAKDLIITGGLNVYPKEIEEVLNAIDGIAESAVFGVPDPDFGEQIIAAIVPSGAMPPDRDTIATTVSSKLARFKHPRQYVVMSELPRNAMGKVQKNLLRAEYDPQTKNDPE